MTNDVVKDLQKSIGVYRRRENGLLKTIDQQATDYNSLLAAFNQINGRLCRLENEFHQIVAEIGHVNKAVLEISQSPHIKKIMSKGRFEPLFKPSNDEVV